MAADDLECDLAIIGGGLAGGLAALALAQARPDLSIRLIEASEALGGNHVWSFFDADLDANGHKLIAPLVSQRWAGGHDVRFPSFSRTLPDCYNSIHSTDFDHHLRTALGDRVMTGAPVTALTPTSVMLHDGKTLRAGGVIDARGFSGPHDPRLTEIACGWQKFVGQTLRLSAPHGLTRPVIMDASVEQIDGYRFVYLLPGDANTIFVEDTYYSDGPELDAAAVSARIADYAAAQGWQVEGVDHQETGVLPVVIAGRFDRFWPHDDPVARAGVGAGLFHPTTGYSLPIAVKFALALAKQTDFSGSALTRWSRAYAASHWASTGYYRMLDRMLFRAAPPAMRYRIFQRFYRLSPRLIGRFYSANSSALDKLRILCGKPPVPIRAAMLALMKKEA